MFSSEFSLLYVILTLGFSFVATKIIYHFKFRHDLQSSSFEKSIRDFKLESLFYLAVLFAALFFLPSESGFEQINLEKDSQETVLRGLVENQIIIKEHLAKIKWIQLVVLFFTGSYVFALFGFLGELQKKPRQTFNEDSIPKKPLGL